MGKAKIEMIDKNGELTYSAIDAHWAWIVSQSKEGNKADKGEGEYEGEGIDF